MRRAYVMHSSTRRVRAIINLCVHLRIRARICLRNVTEMYSSVCRRSDELEMFSKSQTWFSLLAAYSAKGSSFLRVRQRSHVCYRRMCVHDWSCLSEREGGRKATDD